MSMISSIRIRTILGIFTDHISFLLRAGALITRSRGHAAEKRSRDKLNKRSRDKLKKRSRDKLRNARVMN